ncbi:MAG: M23 family metallopeptidase [Cyclobacteriaceae bacterium]|nr:M23 family metallopeptidase [Cyclobacteriaceae bacterium]
MGELRSSHFHTGIDIRTGGQEGLKVLAADNGYVFRISVNPSGYGNTIYIKHPNGHTTVYAHLKSFRKDIAEYVRKEQYSKNKFKLNVFPDGSTFKVKRGDVIALSGNSGSSGGPHLHFDVRNRNQNLLNPLHYGFSEITDIRPPLAKNLALVTTTIGSRVNGEFGRIEIPFEYNKSDYFINDTIYAVGRIGLELYAYDRMNNTRFKTGINKIEVLVNDKIHLITSIDTWSFSKARQFYTYTNYEALVMTGKRYHKLYIDKGNHLPFYSLTTDQGYLTIEEGKIYVVKINLTDSYNNKSTVDFVIKGSKINSAQGKNTKAQYGNWSISTNTLIIMAKKQETVLLGNKPIQATYTTEQYAIYLHNLKQSIPSSYLINGETKTLPIKAFIKAGSTYKYYHKVADIQFWKSTLFKDFYFTFESKLDTTTGVEIITIGNSNIPLNKNYSVTFKPSNIPISTKYLAVYGVWGKNSSFVGGKWNGTQISFKSRNFGSYTILADSISPTIKPLILTKDEMAFKISDNLSGIATITMRVNGEWVLMNYDPKKSLIWAEKPRSSFNFKGKIKLTVTDKMDNEAIHSTEIK